MQFFIDNIFFLNIYFNYYFFKTWSRGNLHIEIVKVQKFYKTYTTIQPFWVSKIFLNKDGLNLLKVRVKTFTLLQGFPVAQMVEHGASNAKIMGSIPRESKSW